MRKLLLFIVFLILLELGATYYVGGVAEQYFRDRQTFLGNNQFISSEIIAFNRGLFSSEAVTESRVNFLPSITFKIKHTIWNGPIIFTQDLRAPLHLQMAVIKSEPLEAKGPIQIPFNSQTILQYNGATETTTKGSAFKAEGKDFQASGLAWQYQSRITGDRLGFKGDISFPEVNVLLMGMHYTFKAIQLHYNQNRTPFGNWLGTISFVLGEGIQKEKKINILDFHFDEASGIQEQAVDLSWKITFQKLSIADVNYGPLNFEILIQKLDPEFLRFISQIQQGLVSDSNKQDMYKRFLLRKPKIVIKPSSISVPQGEVKLALEISIGGSDVALPINKETVEKTLEGYVQASVPKEIVRDILKVGLKDSLEKDPTYQKKSDSDKKIALDQAVETKIQKLKQNGILNETEKSFDINMIITGGNWVVKEQIEQKPVPTEKKNSAIVIPLKAPVIPVKEGSHPSESGGQQKPAKLP